MIDEYEALLEWFYWGRKTEVLREKFPIFYCG
jgi:hypothetical protein